MLLPLDEELVEIYVGLHVKWLIFLSEFKETRIFSTKFRKFSTNIEFHNSLSSGTDRRDEVNANAPFLLRLWMKKACAQVEGLPDTMQLN